MATYALYIACFIPADKYQMLLSLSSSISKSTSKNVINCNLLLLGCIGRINFLFSASCSIFKFLLILLKALIPCNLLWIDLSQLSFVSYQTPPLCNEDEEVFVVQTRGTATTILLHRYSTASK